LNKYLSHFFIPTSDYGYFFIENKSPCFKQLLIGGNPIFSSSEEYTMKKIVHLLDHGFVGLIDHMGNDERICQAARISSIGAQSASKGEEKDKTLIDYLMRNRHTSPFEQVLFTFHIKCPIFIARQWFRHRTGRFNEISGRYSVINTEFYIPDEIRMQSKDNMQGSSGTADAATAAEIVALMKQEQQDINTHYNSYIDKGVAREIARINLPLSTYTEFYFNTDLHNLLNFISLRIDAHAQKEIQVYAQAILDIIREIVPAAVEAWENNFRGGLQLNIKEGTLFKTLLENYCGGKPTKEKLSADGWSDRDIRILLEKLG
jgi:thymidylate synthase (FAD)